MESIGIVGLGYVGIPLASLFAKKYKVEAIDIDSKKISLLQKGIDPTGLSNNTFSQTLNFSSNWNNLKNCSVIIVTVPTDIDSKNRPNLFPLHQVSKMIAGILKKGMIIVFESTVYPGLTEEVCIPILEKESGLIWKKDFNVGYSPERINPGEKQRPLEMIKKIVSGDTIKTQKRLKKLYESVISAGVYIVSSIKVAEASKVIENAQRDLNIAFVNELALIFDRLGIDTREVLEAAATKWNFLPFEPGIVGGQCIGVDPYYLTYKAEQLGYYPKVIHSGRIVNNEMCNFIASKVVKHLINQGKNIGQCKILILGCAFKENIGDIRNSKVFDIINELIEYSVNVTVFDPLVHKINKENNNSFIHENIPKSEKFDAVILAVKHDIFKKMSLTYLSSISTNNDLNLFDIKSFYNINSARKIAKFYWRL